MKSSSESSSGSLLFALNVIYVLLFVLFACLMIKVISSPTLDQKTLIWIVFLYSQSLNVMIIVNGIKSIVWLINKNKDHS